MKTGGVVVDCSYVAAFFLQEAEGRKFEDILLEREKKGFPIRVPPLFLYEMMNVFLVGVRKGRISSEASREMRRDLSLLPLEEMAHPDRGAGEEIQHLAKEYDLTAYDAAYLELAMRLDADLRTLDTDLLKLRDRFGWISEA